MVTKKDKLVIKEVITEYLKDFGISYSDLAYLPLALQIVKSFKDQQPVSNLNTTDAKGLTKEQEKKLKQNQMDSLTAEKVIEMFSGKTEEFRLNG